MDFSTPTPLECLEAQGVDVSTQPADKGDPSATEARLLRAEAQDRYAACTRDVAGMDVYEFKACVRCGGAAATACIGVEGR